MSTVIGLVHDDQQQLNQLKAKLAAIGCALDKIKIVTQPAEAHALLDRWAFVKCDARACTLTGAILGLAIFMPLGLMVSLHGCAILGCSGLVWLTGLGGLSLIGAIFGAIFGSFFGANRFEEEEHVYTEGVGWGHQLVMVTTDTEEKAAQTVSVLEQEHAAAIKILDQNL